MSITFKQIILDFVDYGDSLIMPIDTLKWHELKSMIVPLTRFLFKNFK